MAYFSEDFTDFFGQLSRNNERDWYHANKKRYETKVKQPFERFVAEVIDRISLLDPDIALEPRDAVFRLARDIRFSKDKTPYKTHAAAVITREGRRDTQYPGLYIRLDANGAAIGGGMYQPDKNNLLKIRRAIVRDGRRLIRATRGKRFVDTFGELRGEKNKRLPSEFAEHVGRYPIIANKQFYYFAEYDDPDLLLRDDLVDFVLGHYRAGQKVNEFLKAAIS